MAYILSSVSQKGGVGKSTLSRLIAREASINGLSVKIADLDVGQGTCTKWAARRIQAGIKPEIEVQPVGDVERAIKEAENYDVYIFDGAPQASKQSLMIAKASDLILLPTNEGIEDREPAVELANDLYEKGVDPDKIAFALCLTLGSPAQVAEARRYLQKTQYQVLEGELPAKPSMRTILKAGKAPTETPFKNLREGSDQLAQNIINAVVQAKGEPVTEISEAEEA